MDLLNQITGGGTSRDDLDDFARRYDDGPPWQGISDDEAVDKYRRVADNVPDDVYEESARDAFSRLDPDQRAQIGQGLTQTASDRGMDLGSILGGLGGGGIGGALGGLMGGGGQGGSQIDDPDSLARLATGMRRQQPGLIEQVLGGSGGSGGFLGGGIGKAAMAGIAAMAFRKIAGGR